MRWRWIEAAGLPEPELQIAVCDDESGDLLYRIDLGHEALRFGAEYDGRQWHSVEHQDHDLGRREVLAREFGWTIDTFRADNVFGQGQDATYLLSRAFREARRSYGARSLRWL